MSGHNKWSQIKHKKGASDAAKSKLWSKLAKRIALESKKARGEIAAPALRTWVEKAKQANMPKENIGRAVKRGTTAESGAMEAVTYETYGPGGAAIVIDALTDNRNRAAQEIKHLLSGRGLSLASPGSAAWAFEKTADGLVPKMTVPLSESDNESLLKILEEIDAHDDVEEVFTNAA